MNSFRARAPWCSSAFSLLEVIAAVALLAGGALALLGLFAAVIGGMRETAERSVAAQLVERAEQHLRSEARRSAGGFDGFIASTALPRLYVASRDGGRIEPAATTTLEPAAQFFAVEVARARAPLGSPGSGYIVLVARVSWPHHGGGTAVEGRSVIQSVIAVSP